MVKTRENLNYRTESLRHLIVINYINFIKGEIMELYITKRRISKFINTFMFKFNDDMYWKELNNDPTWHGISKIPNDSKILLEKRRITIQTLNNTLVKGTVLEIGAGKKYYTDLMQDWGYDVYATDYAWSKNNYDVTTEPLDRCFDNVVAIGVLHHIQYDRKFTRALKNIKAMAKKRIILGVKINAKPIKIAKQRPMREYNTILGKPTIIQDAQYLTMLVFNLF